jgi:large repetitive protein
MRAQPFTYCLLSGLLAAALFASCAEIHETASDQGDDSGAIFESVDGDDDGYNSDVDCDDHDNDINPGMDEVCNGFDDDCNGLIDDEDPDLAAGTTFYLDADGDGSGIDTKTVVACQKPKGFAPNPGDCDDADPAYHPGAPETDCADPNDYNCDGNVGYKDEDEDGFAACKECDDTNPDVNPDAVEVCNGIDDNCDLLADDSTAADASTWYRDADDDHFGNPDDILMACVQPYGYEPDNTDCDDTTPRRNPGNAEVCDGLDNNCNDLIDDADPTVEGQPTWYRDADNDTWGTDSDTVVSCATPSGYVGRPGDCDDTSDLFHPEADGENCTDPNDYNCDGDVSYIDADSDGFPMCLDCNDANSDINPAETETCNGIDDNCDGLQDDPSSADALTWYQDLDADGAGNAAVSTLACNQPYAYVPDNTDCDDTLSIVNPKHKEVCDGYDNNCDGLTDDDDPTVRGQRPYFEDADGDGFGNNLVNQTLCYPPTGYVEKGDDCDDTSDLFHPGARGETCTDPNDYNCDGVTAYVDADGDTFPSCLDCNDTDAAINPSAVETCNGIDDNCDGLEDDPSSADAATWYQDLDADGAGNASVTTVACNQPYAYVPDNTDCDDTLAIVNPKHKEVCDTFDNNCDGLIDDEDPTVRGQRPYYEDADGDGFGNNLVSQILCSAPTGYVDKGDDCDDTSDLFHPGARGETCTDPNDYNCDGSVAYVDADDDGFPACLDCNDADAAINPSAVETCNGIDDNCDGLEDDPSSADAFTWYQDADGDTYGNPAVTTVACEEPYAYVALPTDCDDTLWSTNPGAAEIPGDNLDNDCNGVIDG